MRPWWMALSLAACSSGGTEAPQDTGQTGPTDTGEARSYANGWPTQPAPFKDGLEATDQGDTLAEGVRFPRVLGPDAFGDVVDLYDLAGHGTPILVNATSTDDPDGRILAAAIKDGGTEQFPDWRFVVEAIRDGRLRFLEILCENDRGRSAKRAAVEGRQRQLRHGQLILADRSDDCRDFVLPTTSNYPTYVLTNETFLVRAWWSGTGDAVVDDLAALFPREL